MCAVLGELPEDPVTECRAIVGGGLLVRLHDTRESGFGRGVADLRGCEERREANGARAHALRFEVLEALSNRSLQIGERLYAYTRACGQSFTHGWLSEMENQLIGAEARNITTGIKARQFVIEIVGEENGF